MPPSFELENKLSGLVAGFDEVGRGPWAGPVVAAAVILNRNALPPQTLTHGINDSKKLSRSRREALFAVIMATAHVGIGEASVEEIDRLNILQASLLAMRRALAALPLKPDHALVDGNRDPGLKIPTQCIVKGDSLSFSVAAASIIAKVTRDKMMQKLAEIYPAYGWERNAGYGTAEHAKALKLVGITPHHRKSFAPIREFISQDS